MYKGYSGADAKSIDQIKRDRKKADALTWRMGVPTDLGSGLTHLGQAIAIRKLNNRADDAMSGLVDSLGADHPAVMGLMDLPKYALGTDYHPGGKAVVGEHGPEVVDLPRGSKVRPNQRTYDMIAQAITGQQPDPRQPVAGPMTVNGIPPEFPIEQYDPASQQRLRENPEEMQPAPIDMRELLQPQSRFDDANAVQVADASGELPYGDAKLTGDQSKAIAYYRRGFGANQVLSDPTMGEALTQFTDTFAGNFGGFGRMFQDADYQVAKRAADEFLAAILRKDTGAAITNEEFKLYGPMYLPMPGDKPELLEAKAKARQEALTAIEMGLGTAAPLADITRQELSPKTGGATHRFNPDTRKIEEITQ